MKRGRCTLGLYSLGMPPEESLPYGHLVPPQEAPRAVHLMPEDLFLPAKVLRTLIAGTGQLSLRYTGYALTPFIRDGDIVEIETSATVEIGDLALFDAGGWADVRRVQGRTAEGQYVTSLDAFPRASEVLLNTDLIGRVVLSRNLLCLGNKLVPKAAIWPRLASYRYRLRRLEEAAFFTGDSRTSVLQKYRGQVASYEARVKNRPNIRHVDLSRYVLPDNARVLVAGCGAGSEAISLALEGYRVDACDLVPAMLDAGRRNARLAEVEINFFLADIAELDLPEEQYDVIYITALVYSFVPKSACRQTMLFRLGQHLRPGGRILYSAKIKPLAKSFPQCLAWVLGSVRGYSVELGDWYTWYLSPKGRVGKSYSHTFFHPALVLREAQLAGFECLQLKNGHFLATLSPI